VDATLTIVVGVLATLLAVFLLLGIVLFILLLRISRQIKTITDRTEKATKSAETAVKNVQQFTSPLALATLVRAITKRKGGSHVKRK